eukprot:NODE_254_length_11700_cov_0.671580.p10 type:complete len:144 gc:universal NODE_254_length_11700_cov_0.671580:6415-6846(+)
MIITRPIEYLITYQSNEVQVLPKKHPFAKRRKSVPVPCELVELLKSHVSSDILPDVIKLVYLFKVPRPTVELAIQYLDFYSKVETTERERVMASVLISHKVNHDLVIKNAMWSKYAEVSTKRLTELERQLLQKLQFSVYVNGI